MPEVIGVTFFDSCS